MLKIFLFATIFSMAVAANAQSSLNNFFIKDKVITWQGEFDVDTAPSDLFNKVILSGILKDAKMHEHIIYGELSDFYFDYKRYNQKLSLIERAFLSTRYTGYFTLQVKGNVAIASIKKIFIYGVTDDISLYLSPLEQWAIKKDDPESFSKSFNNDVLNIMNMEFERILKDFFKKS